MSKIQCAADLFQSQSKDLLTKPPGKWTSVGMCPWYQQGLSFWLLWLQSSQLQVLCPLYPSFQPLTNSCFSTSKKEVMLVDEWSQPTARLNQHEEWIVRPQGRSAHLFTSGVPATRRALLCVQGHRRHGCIFPPCSQFLQLSLISPGPFMLLAVALDKGWFQPSPYNTVFPPIIPTTTISVPWLCIADMKINKLYLTELSQSRAWGRALTVGG